MGSGGSGDELKRKAIPGRVYEIILPEAVSHMKTIQDTEEINEVTIHGRALHASFNADVDNTEEVLKRLADGGIPISEWREIAPSLEDVFVTLMK